MGCIVRPCLRIFLDLAWTPVFESQDWPTKSAICLQSLHLAEVSTFPVPQIMHLAFQPGGWSSTLLLPFPNTRFLSVKMPVKLELFLAAPKAAPIQTAFISQIHCYITSTLVSSGTVQYRTERRKSNHVSLQLKIFTWSTQTWRDFRDLLPTFLSNLTPECPQYRMLKLSIPLHRLLKWYM